MEAFGILLVLALVVVVFVLPIAAFVRSGRAVRHAEEISARITALQLELARLKHSFEQPVAPPSHATERTAPAPAPRPESALRSVFWRESGWSRAAPSCGARTTRSPPTRFAPPAL